MSSPKAKIHSETEMAQFIKEEIKAFARNSSLNQIPTMDNQTIYDEPLVQFADGDDPLFAEYKTIVHPTHLTPREAMAKALNRNSEDLPAHLSIISWILPFTSKIREANRRHKLTPSRFWLSAYWYGEKFNNVVREHVVKLLTEMGYLAVAPVIQPYFKMELSKEKGYHSNWSERHIAYAAGLGSFSLSDGFITERGIAHRCGSAVTDLALPVSSRTAKSPYSNCLFYINSKCKACITRCPAGAITENGHDKRKCQEYIKVKFYHLLKELTAEEESCGLCQTKVPCEFRNPAKNLNRKTA